MSLQKGRLPFQNAAMYGHTEALKLLLKEPDVQVDSLMKVHVIVSWISRVCTTAQGSTITIHTQISKVQATRIAIRSNPFTTE